MFEHKDVDKTGRLDKEDAIFVDVLHTDIGFYGFTSCIGHVDYFAHGGFSQPGCPDFQKDSKLPSLFVVQIFFLIFVF